MRLKNSKCDFFDFKVVPRERFERVDGLGRRGVVSLDSIDSEYFAKKTVGFWLQADLRRMERSQLVASKILPRRSIAVLELV